MSIRKIQSKPEGSQDDVCKTKRLIFEVSILITVRKTLQETSLVVPKLMHVCRKVIRTFDKLINIIEHDDGDAFHCDDNCPAASERLEQLTNKEKIAPVCQTQANVTANPGNNYSKFHGYIMESSIEDTIATCHSKFIDILLNLKTALTSANATSVGKSCIQIKLNDSKFRIPPVE